MFLDLGSAIQKGIKEFLPLVGAAIAGTGKDDAVGVQNNGRCLHGYPVVVIRILIIEGHGPGESVGIAPRADLAGAFAPVLTNAYEVDAVFIVWVYVCEAPQRGAAFGSPGGEVIEDDRAAPQTV